MRKPRFKKGDKVRVLDGRGIPNYTGGFADCLRQFIGDVREIIGVDTVWLDGRVAYFLKGCGHYYFDERGLKLVESPEHISVERHGNKVVAKYDGKVGVAKCSPEDKFDFRTGAQLALDRLFGEEPKFAVGDVVIGNQKANLNYGITREGFIGIVTSVEDEEITIAGSDCGRYTVMSEDFDLVISKKTYTQKGYKA